MEDSTATRSARCDAIPLMGVRRRPNDLRLSSRADGEDRRTRSKGRRQAETPAKGQVAKPPEVGTKARPPTKQGFWSDRGDRIWAARAKEGQGGALFPDRQRTARWKINSHALTKTYIRRFRDQHDGRFESTPGRPPTGRNYMVGHRRIGGPRTRVRICRRGARGFSQLFGFGVTRTSCRSRTDDASARHTLDRPRLAGGRRARERRARRQGRSRRGNS